MQGAVAEDGGAAAEADAIGMQLRARMKPTQ